jgi:Kef-type K+ transport system membrane component KefB
VNIASPQGFALIANLLIVAGMSIPFSCLLIDSDEAANLFEAVTIVGCGKFSLWYLMNAAELGAIDDYIYPNAIVIAMVLTRIYLFFAHLSSLPSKSQTRRRRQQR